MEELVTDLISLTTSNAEMAATIKKIPGENQQLQQQLNILKSFHKKNAVLVDANQ